jgi:hypothetical protein
MRSPFYAAFASVLATALLGCGTVIHGTSERVGIASLPRGAMVTVDDTYVGTTPITVEMPRSRAHTVHIECAGYEPYAEQVQRHTSGAGWSNLLFFPVGIVGLFVDIANGGMYKLSTTQVAARLVPDSVTFTGEASCATDEHTAAPRTGSDDSPLLAP